jgi:hypothetical protein
MQHHPHGGASDQSATLLQGTKQHLEPKKLKRKGLELEEKESSL